MKKNRIICLLMILALAGSVFAQGLELKLKPPVFSGTGNFTTAADQLNAQLATLFNPSQIFWTEITDELGAFNGAPNDLITAMGNSSLYSSHGASFQGYYGYNGFAIAFGPAVGIQIPSHPLDFIHEIEGLEQKLMNTGDIVLGLNPQVLNAQVGFKLPFTKKLYLGVQGGYMKLSNDTLDQFSLNLPLTLAFDTLSLGARANFQLIPQVKLAGGLILWRGLNIGSGFIYQKTNLTVGFPLDLNQSSSFIAGGENVVVKLNPNLNLNMEVNTFTVPLEAVTSIRLLWFLNITAGAGIDFGFGTSKLNAGLNIDDISIDVSDIIATAGPGDTLTQVSAGSASLNLGGEQNPQFFNPKLMVGVGINLGPVIIDVPVTWYFIDNGVSVGVTLGLVF